ncbi:MAG: DNA alkylation repair protein [Candidatus Paceibacterota bacterium]|jgi:3-methyladenine DNA glycosylase AlkD
MIDFQNVKKDLINISDFSRVDILQRFFKTKKGEYGEGDIFLGIFVPNIRKISKKYGDLYIEDIKELLYSKIHEERLCALLILVNQFEEGNEEKKKKIFDFYIRNVRQVNNWDLVDLSAPKIVGTYLLNKPKKVLYKFSESKNLWERRVSIISTFAFIKEGNFIDTLRISKVLLKDEHDLIQKAVGWMLREVGKREEPILEGFLIKNHKNTSRTTLRYAIEKFPESKRQFWLRK